MKYGAILVDPHVTHAGDPIWELTPREVPDSWIGTTHIPATTKEDKYDG